MMSGTVVAEGRILPVRSGFLLRALDDGRFCALVIDEDPAGLIGLPVRVSGVAVAPGRLAVIAIERLCSGNDDGGGKRP